MHPKNLIRSAAITLLTWLIAASCALMVYAEGTGTPSAGLPEAAPSLWEENAFAQTEALAVCADGTGLYDQLRACYAPNEPSDTIVSFRLYGDGYDYIVIDDSTDAVKLENGQTYTVSMSLGYYQSNGSLLTGKYQVQPVAITVELFCFVDVEITGSPEGGVALNGLPFSGTGEIYDYTGVTLEVEALKGYGYELLVNGTCLPSNEDNLYQLDSLEPWTEIRVRYFRTNVQYATMTNATVSLESEADCFTVAVTPDDGYAVEAIRINGGVQSGVTYNEGTAWLTQANDGAEEYLITADIVREEIAFVPSPVITCRAGWEDRLTKSVVFAAIADPAASVPACLTEEQVEIQYWAGGWVSLEEAPGAGADHLFGEEAQEKVRILYLGSADGQYPAFTSEETWVAIDQPSEEIWLEQPAHAVITCEPTGTEDEFLVVVTPEEGYAVAEIAVTEGQGDPVIQEAVRFEDGAAFFILYHTGGEACEVTAQVVKPGLALHTVPVLVLREKQSYTGQELADMVFEAAVNPLDSTPPYLTAEDLEIRYSARGSFAGGVGEALDYEPCEAGEHAFGEKDTEYLYLTYSGSEDGRYRAFTQELTLFIQHTRYFALELEVSGAGTQGGAVLTAAGGAQSRVIEEGGIWEDGETVTLSVTPVPGYRYEVAVNGTGLPLRQSNTYPLGIIAEDTVIRVNYFPAELSVEETGNASVEIGLPNEAGWVLITADPDEGYAVTALCLDGEALANVTYWNGVATTLLLYEQLEGASLTVETVKEELVIRTTDLTGFPATEPSGLKELLFEAVLDAEGSTPPVAPEEIVILYLAEVSIPELGWSQTVWLPLEAQVQEAWDALADEIAALQGSKEALVLRPFGSQGSESLRLMYIGNGQYRPFTQEIVVRLPDSRRETVLRLPQSGLSAPYGTAPEDLKAQLLALAEVTTAEGEAIAWAEGDLSVETDLVALPAGTHTVTLTYRGNSLYSPASAQTQVTITAGTAAVSLRLKEEVDVGEAYNLQIDTDREELCYAVVMACTEGEKQGYICLNLSDSAKEQMRVKLPGETEITDLYRTVLAPALERQSLAEVMDTLAAFSRTYGEALPGLQLEGLLDLLRAAEQKLPYAQGLVCLEDTFTQAGTYFVGVVTVDANYQCVADSRTLTIRGESGEEDVTPQEPEKPAEPAKDNTDTPAAPSQTGTSKPAASAPTTGTASRTSGVSLEWNNQGKLLQIMSKSQAARTDFGATLYDENLPTTSKVVKNSVMTLCAGITSDRQFYISSVGPEDAGLYLEAAFALAPAYWNNFLFRGLVIFTM